MSQLVFKIWALLALSAAIGITVGWLVRAVGVREMERSLRREAEKAQTDARAQRDEAARLAAKLQTKSQNTSSQDQVRLEAELRSVQAQADREAAHANDLRARLRSLEDQIAADSLKREDEAREASPLGDKGEAARLRIELARLRADQAAQAQAKNEAQSAETVAMQAENAELRAELERLSSFEDEARQLRLAALNSEADTLQIKLEKAERILQALSEADEAGYGYDEGGDLPPWRHARVRWLEHEIAQLRMERANSGESGGFVAVGDSAKTEDVIDQPTIGEDVRALLARVAELEGQVETARAAEAASREGGDADGGDTAGGVRADSDSGDDVSALSRLTWRNKYLTSRVKFLEDRAQTADGAGDDGEGAAALEAEALELARLRARVEDLERRNEDLLALKPAGDGEPSDDGEDDGVEPVAWRNRYLSSRVTYLEGLVQQLQAREGGDPSAVHGEVKSLQAALAGAKAQADEAARLRLRVKELEGQGSEDAASHAPSDERALEWRNRYLTSRVRYLEERLATQIGDAGDVPVEADAQGDHEGAPIV